MFFNVLVVALALGIAIGTVLLMGCGTSVVTLYSSEDKKDAPKDKKEEANAACEPCSKKSLKNYFKSR